MTEESVAKLERELQDAVAARDAAYREAIRSLNERDQALASRNAAWETRQERDVLRRDRERLTEDLRYATQRIADLRQDADRLSAELERARETLTKINAIRDSIIGLQAINWSEHVYPLVAAIDAAGFVGMGYDAGRKHFGSMLERTVKAEDELKGTRETIRRLREELRQRCVFRNANSGSCNVCHLEWLSGTGAESDERHKADCLAAPDD